MLDLDRWICIAISVLVSAACLVKDYVVLNDGTTQIDATPKNRVLDVRYFSNSVGHFFNNSVR